VGLSKRDCNNNIGNRHFTIRGCAEGGFRGGRYHGRLIFPVDYPFKVCNYIAINQIETAIMILKLSHRISSFSLPTGDSNSIRKYV
jgi:hypothetical protein